VDFARCVTDPAHQHVLSWFGSGSYTLIEFGEVGAWHRDSSGGGIRVARTCQQDQVHGAEHYYLSCAGTEYLCHPHHRGKGYPKKSKWAVSRPEECHVFCQVEGNSRLDPDSSGVWYVSRNAKLKLGTRNERLAYFEEPRGHHAWHGYPVGSGRKGTSAKRPEPEVVAAWVEAGRIESHIGVKIRRGRI